METLYSQMTNEEASAIIDKLLTGLQKRGTTIKALGEGIKYDYLSKARKYAKYKDESFSTTRSLASVLKDLCDHTGVTYNQKNGTFSYPQAFKLKAEPEKESYYLYYYYVTPLHELGRGIMTFFGNKKVKLEVYDFHSGEKGKIKSVWEGRCNREGKHLFIQQTKTKHYGMPTDKKQCFHTYTVGSSADFRDLCLGAYLGMRNDDFPISGEGILMKVKDRSEAEATVMAKPDQRIHRFLTNKSILTESKTYYSVDALIQDAQISKFFGRYSFYYNEENYKLQQGELHLQPTGQAQLTIKENRYGGYFKLNHSQGLQISLSGLTQDGWPRNPEATLYLYDNMIAPHLKIFSGFGVQSEFFILPQSFSFMLIAPELDANADGARLKPAISSFFGECNGRQVFNGSYTKLVELLEGVAV